MLPDLYWEQLQADHLQGPGQPQPPTETTATVIQGKSQHTSPLPRPRASC